MRRYVLMVLTALVLVCATVASFTQPTKAFSPFGSVCNNGGSGSTVCADQGNGSTNPLTGPNGLILKATYVVAGVAGFAAVVVIVLAGLNYISSGGDPAKTKAAKSAIINTIVGLAFILLAGSIISLIVSRL